MSRVGRLAGALLAETQGQYFLVGDLKEPCDFAAVGFEPPGEIKALKNSFVKLSPTRPIVLSAPCLKLDVEGEALAILLAQRLVIQRNSSVSDRLWRVLTHAPEGKTPPEIEARWFGEVPEHLWQIVRDQILKCS